MRIEDEIDEPIVPNNNNNNNIPTTIPQPPISPRKEKREIMCKVAQPKFDLKKIEKDLVRKSKEHNELKLSPSEIAKEIPFKIERRCKTRKPKNFHEKTTPKVQKEEVNLIQIKKDKPVKREKRCKMRPPEETLKIKKEIKNITPKEPLSTIEKKLNSPKDVRECKMKPSKEREELTSLINNEKFIPDEIDESEEESENEVKMKMKKLMEEKNQRRSIKDY